MGKNNRSKQDSKPDRKCQPNDRNQPKVNCILHFKDLKPSDDSIKAKFYEADETDVSEQIRKFKTGDYDANLVALMNQIVGLGDLYKMCEDGKSRKLAQTMSRALKGQVRDDLLEIIADHDWNDESKQNFIRLLQNLGTKTFGPTAFKDQCKAMQKGKIKIPENNVQK
jgi:hypothetical protein